MWYDDYISVNLCDAEKLRAGFINNQLQHFFYNPREIRDLFNDNYYRWQWI